MYYKCSTHKNKHGKRICVNKRDWDFLRFGRKRVRERTRTRKRASTNMKYDEPKSRNKKHKSASTTFVAHIFDYFAQFNVSYSQCEWHQQQSDGVLWRTTWHSCDTTIAYLLNKSAQDLRPFDVLYMQLIQVYSNMHWCLSTLTHISFKVKISNQYCTNKQLPLRGMYSFSSFSFTLPIFTSFPCFDPPSIFRIELIEFRFHVYHLKSHDSFRWMLVYYSQTPCTTTTSVQRNNN